MNMREKIARAMASSDGFDPDYEMEGERRLPSGVPIFKHPMYQKYADAVLDALMEPTTGMQYAALPLVDRMHQTRDVFVSMIDAAKEGK